VQCLSEREDPKFVGHVRYNRIRKTTRVPVENRISIMFGIVFIATGSHVHQRDVLDCYLV